MGSLNSLAGNLFYGIFALIFGYFADHLRPARAMLIGELLLFSVVALYWKMFKKTKL